MSSLQAGSSCRPCAGRTRPTLPGSTAGTRTQGNENSLPASRGERERNQRQQARVERRGQRPVSNAASDAGALDKKETLGPEEEGGTHNKHEAKHNTRNAKEPERELETVKHT